MAEVARSQNHEQLSELEGVSVVIAEELQEKRLLKVLWQTKQEGMVFKTRRLGLLWDCPCPYTIDDNKKITYLTFTSDELF